MVMLTLGMTVLWLVGAAVSSAILQHELGESFDRSEAELAQRLLPLATDSIDDPDAAPPDRHEHPHHDFEHGTALFYQLRHPDGRVLFKSDDAPDKPLGDLGHAGFSNTPDFRVYSLTDPTSQLTIQVGELLAHRDRAIWDSTLILFLPLLLLIPISSGAIWLAARRGLQPLSALRQEIATRGSANLAPLSVTGLPRELTPIAAAIASLIDRLRSALDAERQFAANSAHELRTPIAAALAQTQRLIETASDEASRVEARKVEATLRRLSSLAEKLMQLARADAGIAASGGPTSLLPVLQLVLSDATSRSRPLREIALDLPAAAETITVPINVDALGIVLRNLIDNAIAHSPSGTPILVAITAEGDVSVQNDSVPLPPEVLSRIRRRFERGVTAAPGGGLGLAIVDAIMSQVGGELSLSSPADGRPDGFEATVRFSSNSQAHDRRRQA